VGQGRPDPQGGGKRRDEARNRKGNRGGWKAPSRLLLGEYLAGTWLPSVKAKVAPSTFTSYRQNITQVANRIGHVRLDALDPPTLDALYADLEAGGLARSTVRLLHTQLHRAMADAVRRDLRHGWATMALEALEHPKVVAEQLGHASVRVTLDTYSHVTPGVQREAVTRWPLPRRLSAA
jgi:site-specific recombinase XerD